MEIARRGGSGPLLPCETRMTTIYLRRTLGGFAPDKEEDHDACKRLKMGEIVRAEVVRPRNILYFRKWWALVKVGYELWEETCPRHQHKGMDVLPEFDRFRRDVTILAGFAKPVVNVRGELRLEAESIAFGNMTEDRFDALYSATIDVLLQKVLTGRGISESQLRTMADLVMDFA